MLKYLNTFLKQLPSNRSVFKFNSQEKRLLVRLSLNFIWIINYLISVSGLITEYFSRLLPFSCPFYPCFTFKIICFSIQGFVFNSADNFPGQQANENKESFYTYIYIMRYPNPLKAWGLTRPPLLFTGQIRFPNFPSSAFYNNKCNEGTLGIWWKVFNSNKF